jgi:hypothetical protein
MKIELNIPGPADMLKVGASNPSNTDAFDPLRMALRLLTDMNVWILNHKRYPSIYNGRIRYKPEQLGKEEWLTIDKIHERGYGDCEDLACARAAEYQIRGIPAEPDCIAHFVQGILVIHIQVHMPDGSIEDPSARLGMKGPS